MTTKDNRNFLAYLGLVALICGTGIYSIVAAIEVAVFSVWGALTISLLCKWWKASKYLIAKLIHCSLGFVLLSFIGLFLFSPILIVATMYAVGSTSMQVGEKLRNIAIAMHNYDADFHYLPQVANLSSENKPLLSWRVHLLPYLGKEELYQRFHLDEPWDSAHNITLLPLMPDCYRMPKYGREAPAGYTYFQLLVGPETLFEIGKQRSLTEAAKKDGLSNTVIAAIAPLTPVPWTSPADLQVQKDLPLLVGPPVNRFPAPLTGWLLGGKGGPGEGNRIKYLFADGTVRSGRHQPFDMKQLWPFITWQGSEELDGNSPFD
ncbi:MAG: DUF1559 domain-containing protein [Gemmatales bacterium]